MISLVILIVVVVGVILLCRENPTQLRSAGGLIVLILFMYVTSKNPRQVSYGTPVGTTRLTYCEVTTLLFVSLFMTHDDPAVIVSCYYS